MTCFHFALLLIRSHLFCFLAAVFFAAASTLSDFLLLDPIHIMNLRVTFNRITAIAALASPSLFAPGVHAADPPGLKTISENPNHLQVVQMTLQLLTLNLQLDMKNLLTQRM